jgi:hypothetical protein
MEHLTRVVLVVTLGLECRFDLGEPLDAVLKTTEPLIIDVPMDRKIMSFCYSREKKS